MSLTRKANGPPNTANERLNLLHLELEKKGAVLTKHEILKALPGIISISQGLVTSPQTFMGMMDLFLADQKEQVGKFISAGTYAVRSRYKKIFRMLLLKLNLIHQPLVNFSEEDIKNIQLKFMDTHANGTVERAMFVFSSIFEYAIKEGEISRNPCKNVRKVKPEENQDLIWLEPDEVEKLEKLELEGLADEFRDAFLFCCWTGLSIGDYLLMNPATSKSQLDKSMSPKNIQPARITKTKEGLLLAGRRRKSGTEYRIPVTSGAQRIIGKYGGIENMPYNILKTGVVLNLLMKQIGVKKKIRFHSARKTFANYLLNEKMINPLFAIEIMGWKQIQEANAYIRVKDSSLYRALFSGNI